jgi:hypothetical protein
MRLSCEPISHSIRYEQTRRDLRLFFVSMNHKYDIDWLAGWIICQRLGIIQVLACYDTSNGYFYRSSCHLISYLGIENSR